MNAAPSAQTRANRSAGGRKAAAARKANRARLEAAAAEVVSGITAELVPGPYGYNPGEIMDRILGRIRAAEQGGG